MKKNLMKMIFVLCVGLFIMGCTNTQSGGNTLGSLNRAYLFLSYINKMVSHLYVNVNGYGKIKNSKKVLTYKNKYSIIPYKINMGKIMETL